MSQSGEKKKKRGANSRMKNDAMNVMSLPAAFKLLMDGAITDWVDSHALGSSIHRVLTSIPTLALLFDFHDRLCKVFFNSVYK